MGRTRWLARRSSKNRSGENVEASHSECPSSSTLEVKTDDENSGSRNCSLAGSNPKTGFVQDAHNWTKLSPCGAKPKPRYNHAATVVGRKMVVVGGESSDGLLDDVQVLHMGKLSWSTVGTTIKTGNNEGLSKERKSQKLPACKGHSLVAWGKVVLLIGGQMDPPSDHVSAWAFDMEFESWSKVEAKGEIPVARSGQSVTKAGSILLMFGGEDVKGRKLKDLHMFDLKSLMWLPLRTMGSGPSPRSKHVAALYNDRYLLIFGGSSKSKSLNDLFSLDFETMKWAKIKTQGFSPSPRAGCGAVLSGDKWYITGGKRRKKRCLETLMFDVSTMTWFNMLISAPNSVLSNQGFSLVLIERKDGTFLVAFGGYNVEFSNEVEVLTTTSPEANIRGCTVAQKEDSSTSTQERTPRALAPVVVGGKLPCSCITVAKHNLASAAGLCSSSQKSLPMASASYTSDLSGILPLRKLLQHKEESIPESTARRNSSGCKENEPSAQSLKGSTSLQGSKYFEEVEKTRQRNASLSVPEADTFEITEAYDSQNANLEKGQIICQGMRQNEEQGASIPCPYGRFGQLPLDTLSSNRTHLAQNSQCGNCSSQFYGEAINVISTQKRIGSLSNMEDQYEVMLAVALKKNAIMEERLSGTIKNKEAAEKSLSTVLKMQHNSEAALSEALKEIEVLKEKVAAAELVQEEANNLSNVVHAENVRLEHDMAFLKAVLDETQKELHTTRGILSAERTRAFQLQVEVFQLRQKLKSSENRASTPKKTCQV